MKKTQEWNGKITKMNKEKHTKKQSPKINRNISRPQINKKIDRYKTQHEKPPKIIFKSSTVNKETTHKNKQEKAQIKFKKTTTRVNKVKTPQ